VNCCKSGSDCISNSDYVCHGRQVLFLSFGTVLQVTLLSWEKLLSDVTYVWVFLECISFIHQGLTVIIKLNLK
jgi:hypothetical protein